MSPAIIVSAPEDAIIVSAVDATENVKGAQESHQEPIDEVLKVLKPEEQLSPSLLAALFIILGIVVFIAVMMKRLTSRPDLIKCSSHMKPTMFTYGSIVYPLDELYKAEVERKAFFNHRNSSGTKTRATKFISVSDLWKEHQSKNNRKINRIPEEPEDVDGYLAFLS